MAWVKLANVAELPPGEVIEAVRGEDLYAICNVNGNVRAIGGTCPHSGGPLGQGTLHDDTIVCPWHMWPFDTKTGECEFNPVLCVGTYATRIEGADILVDLP